MRWQELARDERGYNVWQIKADDWSVPSAKTAIIICDVWDQHWSRAAAERTAVLAPKINQVISVARERGVRVIHASSDTMAFYAESPARRRMRAYPPIGAPAADSSRPVTMSAEGAPARDAALPSSLVTHHAFLDVEPLLPIDDSDGGSDSGEVATHTGWTRQHAAIAIDEERDGISDNGDEIFRFIHHAGIELVLILGVHANMCILHRSFAIEALVRRGIPVALVRDLTDAMYNPAKPPYVSHDEGTRLVVEYIEKFWCPTVESEDVTR
jgi:hypothetical protein